MPQKNAQGIDVSAEEERFLRGAFRRFALPYVIGFAVIAGVAAMLGGSDGEGASPEVVAALQVEVETLEEKVARLETQLTSLGVEVSRAGERVATLEKKPAQAKPSSDPALAKKLRDATSRVAELEKKLADQAIGERFDALAQRMGRIERETRSSSAPAAMAPLPSAPSQPTAPLP